jgi:hypothetical protein
LCHHAELIVNSKVRGLHSPAASRFTVDGSYFTEGDKNLMDEPDIWYFALTKQVLSG